MRKLQMLLIAGAFVITGPGCDRSAAGVALAEEAEPTAGAPVAAEREEPEAAGAGSTEAGAAGESPEGPGQTAGLAELPEATGDEDLPELSAERERQGAVVGGPIEDSDHAYVGPTKGASYGFVAGLRDEGATGTARTEDVEVRPAPGLTRRQAGLTPDPEEDVGGSIDEVEPRVGRQPGPSWGYVAAEPEGRRQPGVVADAQAGGEVRAQAGGETGGGADTEARAEAGAPSVQSTPAGALAREARDLTSVAESELSRYDERIGRLGAAERETARLRRMQDRAQRSLADLREATEVLESDLAALRRRLEAAEENPPAEPGI